MIHFSLLAALCVSANPDAGAAPPWQVGTPGSGVPGWPYVSQIPLGVKRFATLQEAIDAAPDKSTIELPSGVYGLPIKIQKRRGLKLVGLDGGAFLLSQSMILCGGCRPEPVVLISDSSDITLENLFIMRDVRGDEGDLFSATSLSVTTSPNTVFRHVFISSKEGSAASLSASPGATFDDCVIENTLASGISTAVNKDGSGGVVIRSSSIHAKQSAVSASSGEPCDWIDKDKRFPGLKVTDSLLWSDGWPSICPQMAPGFRRNVIVREVVSPTFYNLHLEDQNTVVASPDAGPVLATAPTWRPPAAILGKHLEDFGVLPPPSEDPPKVGTDWPFCIKEINWPLFPEGPRTLDSYAYPSGFSGCFAADLPSSRVVERRKGWVRISTRGGGYSRQGMLQVWQPDDSLFTPCMLQSGGALLWTHALTGSSVEAVDDSRVAVIGSSDSCGNEKLTETLVVPVSLRPATARQWKLKCTAPQDLSGCQ